MKLFRILPLIMPLFLASCADSSNLNSSAPTSGNASITSPATENVSTPAKEETEEIPDEDCVTGVCGERMNRKKFKLSPDTDLLYLYQKDCGYASLFDGKIYNSADNPDKFNLEEWCCVEDCTASSGDIFIVRKGDKINGLTCKNACAEYYIDVAGEDGERFGLRSCMLSFDGEAELTGYIDCFGQNEGYYDEGAIMFYPDEESLNGFPLSYMGEYYTYQFHDGRLINTPMCIMRLGTIYDYPQLNLEQDIALGSTVKARCVFRNFEVIYCNRNCADVFSSTSAELVSVEIID